jgi:very-short-patch-repair endonuclease
MTTMNKVSVLSKKYKLDFPRKCKICKKEIKSKSGLGTHLKNQHEINYRDYLKKYHSIDLNEQIMLWEKNREQRKIDGHKKTGEKNSGKSPKDRMTKTDYFKWYNSMLGVFTLEWFIKKYGEKEGEKLYKERSKNISQKSFFREYNKEQNKKNYSKTSQKFFWELYKNTSFEKVYFAELNHEYSCGHKGNYDFVIIDNKKVIEFNGDMWHANPKIYSKNDIVPILGITAKQIWEKDEERAKFLKENGWQLKIIWESEFKKNKKKSIEDSLEYLLKE